MAIPAKPIKSESRLNSVFKCDVYQPSMPNKEDSSLAFQKIFGGTPEELKKAGFPISIQVADTHANIARVANNLSNKDANIDIIRFNSEEDWKTLIEIEKTFNIYDSDEEKLSNTIKQYEAILARLTLNPDFKDAYLKYKGDTDGDRGNNDLWSDLWNERLEELGLKVSDLHSDHGDFVIRPDQSLLEDPLLNRSSRNFDVLVERGLISEKRAKELKQKRLARRKVVDYDLSLDQDGNITGVYFSAHGVVGPATLEAVAKKLGIDYKADNATELYQTIDAINIKFKKLMRKEPEKYKVFLDEEEEIYNHNNDTSVESIPFYTIIHASKAGKNKNNEWDLWKTLPDNVPVHTYCGHIGQLIGETKKSDFKNAHPNVVNLDSDAGKIKLDDNAPIKKNITLAKIENEFNEIKLPYSLSFYKENQSVRYKIILGNKQEIEGLVNSDTFFYQKLKPLLTKFELLKETQTNNGLSDEETKQFDSIRDKLIHYLAEFHPNEFFERYGENKENKNTKGEDLTESVILITSNYPSLNSLVLNLLFAEKPENKKLFESQQILETKLEIEDLWVKNMPVYKVNTNHPETLLTNFTKTQAILSDDHATEETKKVAVTTLKLLQKIAETFSKEDMSKDEKRYYAPDVEKARRLNKTLSSVDLTTKKGQDTVASFEHWLDTPALNRTDAQKKLDEKINKQLDKIEKSYYQGQIHPKIKSEWVACLAKLAELEATLADYPKNNILQPLDKEEVKELFKFAHKAKNLASMSHYLSLAERNVDAAKAGIELVSKTTEALIKSYKEVGVVIHEIKTIAEVDNKTPCNLHPNLINKYKEHKDLNENEQNQETKETKIFKKLDVIAQIIKNRNTEISENVTSAEKTLNTRRNLFFKSFLEWLDKTIFTNHKTKTVEKAEHLTTILTRDLFSPPLSRVAERLALNNNQMIRSM